MHNNDNFDIMADMNDPLDNIEASNYYIHNQKLN